MRIIALCTICHDCFVLRMLLSLGSHGAKSNILSKYVSYNRSSWSVYLGLYEDFRVRTSAHHLNVTEAHIPVLSEIHWLRKAFLIFWFFWPPNFKFFKRKITLVVEWAQELRLRNAASCTMCASYLGMCTYLIEYTPKWLSISAPLDEKLTAQWST